MNSSDYLRLRTNPKPETPPQGNVDLFFDRADGVLKTRGPEGEAAIVGSAAVTGAAIASAGGALVDLSNVDADASRESLQYSRPAAAGSLVDVTALALSRTKLERQINPIPDEFIVLDTKFESAADITLTTGTAITPGTGLVITSNGVTGCYAYSTANQLLAPCVAVEITVNPAAAGGATQYIAAGITLRSALVNNNYIAGFWDKAAGTVGLDVKNNGVQTTTAGSAFAPTATFKLLTLIYSNSVAIMADTGNGWKLVHLFRNSLTTPWNLRTGWGTNNFVPLVFGSTTTGSWTVTRMRAGYAGYVGLQSLSHVKYEDGTPMIDEQGNYFMHAMASLPFDSPGLSAQWQHCHGMVFKVDPTNYKLTPCAQYFPYRSSEFRLDDGFGNVIYDRSTGQWNWLTQNASQLGAVNAKILNYYATGNLLRGCHVLSDYHEVVMPGTKPRWDADAVKIDGAWYVAYASRTGDLLVGTFFPALASGTALDGTFTAIGSDATQTDAEGMHFAKVGGTYYVCSSTSSGFLIYDMEMSLVDTITPTGFVVGAAPHPHCNMFALPVGNRTRYVIETFNRTTGLGGGAGTYGDREIYESSLYDGNEWPVDSVIPRR